MRRVLIGLVVVLSVVGCSNGVIGDSTILGAYTLRTINGSQLPYTISGSGTAKTEIIDDIITLYEGNTYTEVGHSRITLDGQVTNQTNSETGSYSLFGTSITLNKSDGTRSRIALSTDNNTLTIVESGATSVFKK